MDIYPRLPRHRGYCRRRQRAERVAAPHHLTRPPRCACVLAPMPVHPSQWSEEVTGRWAGGCKGGGMSRRMCS